MRKKNPKQKQTKTKKMHTFVNKCVCHFCCAAHIIAWVKESSFVSSN